MIAPVDNLLKHENREAWDGMKKVRFKELLFSSTLTHSRSESVRLFGLRYQNKPA